MALVCARASSEYNKLDYAQCEANARLIAAAPELLQALREVAGDAHHLDLETGQSECNFCCYDEGEHDPDCTMQFVLAAIAKAEGAP